MPTLSEAGNVSQTIKTIRESEDSGVETYEEWEQGLMKIYEEWEQSLKTLSDEEIGKIGRAMDTLSYWGMFRLTFPEMPTIRKIVEFEGKQRKGLL